MALGLGVQHGDTAAILLCDGAMEHFIQSPPSLGALARRCRSGRLLVLWSTTCNLQGQSPTREEHTNNPVQKPNFRGHAGTMARTRVYKPPTVLQDHQGRENKRTSVYLAASSHLSDFRLDPSVLPAPPCWLLPPFSLISASTRLSCQRHLVLEVARLFQPSPLSPWQIPGQARAN